jgi:2-succinyl-5-enolpyruvyl-6-hydroxy-3-cyclohexene-1-carboxylate synthase
MCALKYEKITSLTLLQEKFRIALKHPSTTLIEVITDTELTDKIHDNLLKIIKQENIT